MNMLDFSPATSSVVSSSPAVIDMNMSAHRRTDKITHHRCSVVIRGELATSQLDSGIIRSVDSPTSLRHIAMASFVVLLRVAFKGPTKGVSKITYS
jgi:hypothetical protein